MCLEGVEGVGGVGGRKRENPGFDFWPEQLGGYRRHSCTLRRRGRSDWLVALLSGVG